MKEDALYDIADAILQLRAAFMRHGFKSPAMIVLEDRNDGDRLRAIPLSPQYLPHQMTPEPVEAVELPVQMKVEICGMQIRYPANRRSERRGGFRYE